MSCQERHEAAPSTVDFQRLHRGMTAIHGLEPAFEGLERMNHLISARKLGSALVCTELATARIEGDHDHAEQTEQNFKNGRRKVVDPGTGAAIVTISGHHVAQRPSRDSCE